MHSRASDFPSKDVRTSLNLISPSGSIVRTAVLIPCFNEELTIAKVTDDFRKALPQAVIYVYDNNSADKTADCARAAGAR